MSQDFGVEIRLPTEGVGDDAVFIHRHGIDSEVAAFKILLERDGWIGVDHKPMITGPRFALGARQRVFLFGVRVQEHREVAAHLRKALSDHFLGRAADHHPVGFMVRVAQQGVADGAAYAVTVHAQTLLRLLWRHYLNAVR